MTGITKIEFAERYADDSGVEFAIRYDANQQSNSNHERGVIEFESLDTVQFPAERLPWIIAKLQYIQSEISK